MASAEENGDRRLASVYQSPVCAHSSNMEKKVKVAGPGKEKSLLGPAALFEILKRAGEPPNRRRRDPGR